MKRQENNVKGDLKSKKANAKKYRILLIAATTSAVAAISLAIAFPISFFAKTHELQNMYNAYRKAHPLYYGSFSEWTYDMQTGNYARINSYETFYNIIYANATVPPVLAAIKSINNGCETYALIERGKTYAGIEETSFHNLGFDPTKIVGRRFSQEEFTNVVNKIKELNKYGHERFNIYTVDYRGLDGAAIAANAQLTDKQYNVYLIEDGAGTYVNLVANYITGKKVTQTIDEPYELFKSQLQKTTELFNSVISKDNNNIEDSAIFNDNTLRAWTLPVLNNFTYILQDKNALIDSFSRTGEYSTKIANIYGIGASSVEVANTDFTSISQGIAQMNPSQKEEYLKLMYGQYYDDTYNTLMRKTLDDGITKVPSQKLVFIPGRIKGFHEVVTNPANGIGGLTDEQEVPSSYDELDSKYKIPFLFDKKEDYDSLLEAMGNAEYWKGTPTEKQKKAAKRAAFNYLLNYMFSLKWTFSELGNKYDFIMKGHPSEEIDHPESWTDPYVVKPEGEGEYNYNYLMSGLALNFHHTNSVGKYIGMVPYGTAAENLAYLGADIALGGLPSSTYTGYDTSIPIEFILNVKPADEHLEQGDGNIKSDPNLSARYEAGNLFYYDNEGKKQTTRFINRGKFYEIMRDKYKATDPLYATYDDLRTNWLKQVTKSDDVTGYSIDDQGFWHAPN